MRLGSNSPRSRRGPGGCPRAQTVLGFACGTARGDIPRAPALLRNSRRHITPPRSAAELHRMKRACYMPPMIVAKTADIKRMNNTVIAAMTTATMEQTNPAVRMPLIVPFFFAITAHTIPAMPNSNPTKENRLTKNERTSAQTMPAIPHASEAMASLSPAGDDAPTTGCICGCVIAGAP